MSSSHPLHCPYDLLKQITGAVLGTFQQVPAPFDYLNGVEIFSTRLGLDKINTLKVSPRSSPLVLQCTPSWVQSPLTLP
jgi:hypothetical protein